MLNRKLFNPDQIYAELYDPARPGGVSLPGFLQPETAKQLLDEIEKNAGRFQTAPREYINAIQEFDFFYLGEKDEKKVSGDFESVLRLRDDYAILYLALAEKAGFQTTGTLNSIAIQRYPKGSVGITPHRDESRYINLISIFVLAGDAPFFITSDRQKSDAVELPARPGDLVLLRAPRDRGDPVERRLRPMHYVGRVEQERYSLTFRNLQPSG